MPVLDNPRHELFAQGVAKGQSQREAYKAAGYESENEDAIDACASRLLTDAKVELRVTELLERAARAAEVTVERTVAELASIGYATIDPAQIKPADKRAALGDLGKFLGMFKERHEVSGPNGGPIETREMSKEEIAKAARLMAFALAKAKQNLPTE